ncbi:MAG: vWA domain-containing protein [Anaerolineae bacterium]
MLVAFLVLLAAPVGALSGAGPAARPSGATGGARSAAGGANAAAAGRAQATTEPTDGPIPGPTPPPATPVPASPTPDGSVGICVIRGRQTADAQRVERGKTVGLRLELSAECPDEVRGRADIMLVVDHSGSMGELGKDEAARQGVRQFVDGVDFSRHTVGLVLFNEDPYVAQPLTTRADRLLRAIETAGKPTGGTDIASAIRLADGELELRSRDEAVAIIVLMTDGISSEESMLEAAVEARDRGTVLFTIGLGDDVAEAPLRKVATTPDHYYFAPGAEQLAEIYVRIASVIRTFAVADVEVADWLSSGVIYVPGTGRPDEPNEGASLKWWRPFLTDEPTVISYRVLPSELGRQRPSANTFADYADGDGVRRRFNFEPAEIEVVEPEVHLAHLPLAWRNTCVPKTAWADVVLAIDVSASMQGDKLTQAIAASKSFLQVLDLTRNQAAVVGYAGEADLAQPLTSNLGDLEAALDGLASLSGTRLDKGIATSLAELGSERHRDRNLPAIVLLTDGRQVEEVGEVIFWSELARDSGVVLVTIALGNDADNELLREIATTPNHAYHAPDAGDLHDIYAKIAGIVRCR